MPAPPAKAPTPGARVTAWRWPASGPVTRGYSSSVHKGIDIAGNRGDPIYAVADGTVVYAGTGIVGFGELVIIKHNDIYISAYGHNDRLLVRENDVVGAGQIIAEKGSSGTDTVKLHFEIRKEGKPIDPVKLLPAR
jgi:lipoprotein NlpD